MEWLKEYDYLANWIFALFAAIFFVWTVRVEVSRDPKVKDYTRAILMFLCLSSVPVAITPTFDGYARAFAACVVGVALIVIINTRQS